MAKSFERRNNEFMPIGASKNYPRSAVVVDELKFFYRIKFLRPSFSIAMSEVVIIVRLGRIQPPGGKRASNRIGTQAALGGDGSLVLL